MKTLKKSALVVALCAAGVIGSTAALADTATVAVSASVTGVCKFNGGGTVSFTLDPTSSADATGTVTQPTFWCTKGVSATLSDDTGLYLSGGSKRMKLSSAAEYIPYAFTYTTTGTGTGKSTPITMNIASTVVNANFINATAGAYADTVTLTIAP